MKKLSAGALALSAAALGAAGVLAAPGISQQTATGAGALASGSVSVAADLQGQGVDLANLSAHAAAVVEAAQDHDLVGGPNDNHGGAVSALARPSPSPSPTSTAAPTAAAPAASPTASPSNHGSDVSTVARDHDATGGKNDNHGGAVSSAAHASPSPTSTSTSTATSTAAPTAATHGSTVSAVAQDPDLTGGKNDNHGGAVSGVARPSASPGSSGASKNGH